MILGDCVYIFFLFFSWSMTVSGLVSEAKRIGDGGVFFSPPLPKLKDMFIKWYRYPAGAIISPVGQLLCHLFLFSFQ